LKNLKQIAQISAGYPFRGKLKEVAGGNLLVLQLKDITNAFFINPASAAKVKEEEIKEQYLLRPGDVVFRSRGQTNTAAIVSSIDGPTVCAAPLNQIRITSPEVLPEYVCWYTNQPDAQTYFNRHAKGTSVRMIGRDALANLPIPIPSIEKQREITAIAKLADQEQRLMEKLAEKKKMMISGILTQVASEAGTGAKEKKSSRDGFSTSGRHEQLLINHKGGNNEYPTK
jgi:restriction endonuclease S subunit